MAYLDHAAANRRKAMSEKYDELKKHIRSLDENGQVSECVFRNRINLKKYNW